MKNEHSMQPGWILLLPIVVAAGCDKILWEMQARVKS